jgi:hypothetical protein
MSIVFEGSYSNKYEALVNDKLRFLAEFFKFNPGEIRVSIIQDIKEFDNLYKQERKAERPSYAVGFAADKGRIFILDKKCFTLTGFHKEEEFERVILHELCHIFIRRILHPKNTFVWIEEGICEFISFGDYPLNIKSFIDLKDLKTSADWQLHHSYQQARAFFKFLSDNYGSWKIVEFIKKIKRASEEVAFSETFGDFEKLQREFFASVSK